MFSRKMGVELLTTPLRIWLDLNDLKVLKLQPYVSGTAPQLLNSRQKNK